jgi:16S rRNA (guanine527-N7)-methyltransferase
MASVPTDREPNAVIDSARRVGLDLDLGLAARLSSFANLLVEIAVPLGMVSKDDVDRLVPRHIVDSLRAAPAIRSLEARSVVDLGSGAGLPGIPLALALPDVEFTLAEVRSKRAAFLELASERLGLSNARVHAGSAEQLSHRQFDAATARAFAPQVEAWSVASPLLRQGGSLILFAGERDRGQHRFDGADPSRVFEPGLTLDLEPNPGDSWRTSRPVGLATGGHLVIITST